MSQLRKLPEGWIWASLEQIADIQGGIQKQPKRQPQKNAFPYLRVANVFRNKLDLTEVHEIELFGDELEKLRLKTGDLLIVEGNGSPSQIGRMAIWDGSIKNCVHQNHIIRARLSDQMSPAFVTAYWNSPEGSERVKQVASSTSGLYTLNVSKVGHLSVPVVPLAGQHRIVAEIDTQFTRLDAVVTAFKRVQANLKRYRASVLRAACAGRLVPTEAELARAEGRAYESADQLLQRILQERRAQWEAEQLANMKAAGKAPKDDAWKSKYREPAKPDTSELSELPKGWVWASIGQAFEVFVGATPSRSKSEYWNGDIPWVSSGEVSFCRIRETREAITELGLRNSSTEVHPPGTVLLGMIGEGKTRGQVAIMDIPACNNQNSAAIRVSAAGLPAEYIYNFLESQYQRTRQLGSGNNQPALNKTRVQEIFFPLPPIPEQQRMVAEIERRLSVIDELEAVIATNLKRADRLRQAILKRAFEGKLVPQNPTDESASVLLERIRMERERTTEKPKAAPQQTNAPQLTGQPKATAPVQGELALGFRG